MKNIWIVLGLVVVVAVALVVAGNVNANGLLPDGVVEWTRSDGSICSAIVTEYGVALDCDCPCMVGCEEEVVYSTLVPTDKPKETQVSTLVPTPIPTEKVHCNNGGGNGDEGCDPQDLHDNPAVAPTNKGNDKD